MHDYADVVVATALSLPPPVALLLDPGVPDAVTRWLGVARRSSTLPAP